MECPCSQPSDIFMLCVVHLSQCPSCMEFYTMFLKLVISSSSHSVHRRPFKPCDDVYPDVGNLSCLNYKVMWILYLLGETGQLTTLLLPLNLSCQSFMLLHMRELSPTSLGFPEFLPTVRFHLLTLAWHLPSLKLTPQGCALDAITSLIQGPKSAGLPSTTRAIGLLIASPTWSCKGSSCHADPPMASLHLASCSETSHQPSTIMVSKGWFIFIKELETPTCMRVCAWLTQSCSVTAVTLTMR